MKKKSIFGVFTIVLVILASLVAAKGRPNRIISADKIKINLLNAGELKTDNSAKALVMLYYSECKRIIPEDVINHDDGTITHYNSVSVMIDYILDTITIDQGYENCRQQIAEAYTLSASRLKNIKTETERKYLGFWEIDDIYDNSVDFVFISNDNKMTTLLNHEYRHKESFNYSLLLWWLALGLVFLIGSAINSKKGNDLEDLNIILLIIFGILWLIVLFSASWPLAIIVAVIVVYNEYVQIKKKKTKDWLKKQRKDTEKFKILHFGDSEESL